MQREIRIGLTGGGTGGHIYPLLAVTDEVKALLERQGGDVTYSFHYFGAPGMYAHEFSQRSIRILPIAASKLRRYFSILNIIDILKLPFAFAQALWKLFWVMPDVLFSKGGTGALPVIAAAYFYRIPIFIHESDSIPGLTNSISYRFAKRVGISFEKTLEYFSGKKTAVIGNPLRPFLAEHRDDDLSSEQAKRLLGFDSELPLVLVMGGSQGSQRINEFLLDIIPDLVTKFQILHQTGVENFADFERQLGLAVKHLPSPLQTRYKIVDFLQKNVKDALVAADIVVSRSGSGSIFDIAYFRKPSILIPLKGSSRNHQLFNAYEYEHAGACAIIEEENFSASLFIAQIEKILGNHELYAKMSQAAGAFSRPDATRIMAEEIVRLATRS